MTTPNATLNSDGSVTYYESGTWSTNTTGISTTDPASTVLAHEQLIQWYIQQDTTPAGSIAPFSPGMVAEANLAIENGLFTADQFNAWATQYNVQAYYWTGTPTTSLHSSEPLITAVNDPLITTDGGVPTQSEAQATYDLGQQQLSASSTQPGPTLTVDHSAAADTVQSAYIAYYGRPADVAGLAYWESQLQAAGGNLNSIINSFGNSTESQALYGGQSVTQEVANIYQQTFDRAPDAAGQAYWVGQISGGAVSLADAALAIFNGATGADKTLISNKLVVADAYTDVLTSDATANSLYAGDTAAANARSYLSAVTTSTTETAQIAGVASQVSHDIASGISADLASVGATPTAVQLVAVSHASVELQPA